MNEKLQAALAELINKANQGVDGAVSFMDAELPDVIHQLLVWAFASNCIRALIGVGIASIVFMIRDKWVTIPKSELRAAYNAGEPWTRIHSQSEITSIRYDSAMHAHFLKSAFCVAVFSVGSLIFISNAMDAAKILIAPKIWLIEYAASLAK